MLPTGQLCCDPYSLVYCLAYCACFYSHQDIAAMRVVALATTSLIVLASPSNSQTRIDAISTNFRWLGPNDKIVVERYDDPKVSNVSCYMSRADTGGIKGGLGF